MNKILGIMSMLLISSGISAGGKTPAAALQKRMKKLQKIGVMIGHQDDPVYGRTWKWDEGRSDVKDIIGDYPALMGFELGGMELGNDKNLDGVPFSRMHDEIINQYQRGGVIELSWHPYNPVTGKNAWDPSGTPVKEILIGGSQHTKFVGWLKTVATFLRSLKTSDGKLVPIIFRPWHEMGGSWFWWGSKSCTPEEYKQLYVYTHDFFTKQLKINSLVWAYSPNSGCDDYLKYYPGDKYVDLLGIDIYDFDADNAKYQKGLKHDLAELQRIGEEHNKLIALTETGAQQLPDPNWFTQTFWSVASQCPISYVLFWRNAWDNDKEMYISAPGHPSEPDFRKFASLEKTLFINDIKHIK